MEYESGINGIEQGSSGELDELLAQIRAAKGERKIGHHRWTNPYLTQSGGDLMSDPLIKMGGRF